MDKQRRVLAVVAHPDDEVLGCGGALALHAAAGDDITVVIMADGETSRGADARDRIAGRESAAHEAGRILGARSVLLHAFPDNQLDTLPRLELAKAIETHVAALQPDVVYTHHAGDLNVDHRRTHEAVVTACRPQQEHPVKALLFFEIPSSTEWQAPGAIPAFVPNWFIDISTTLKTKLNALRAYEAEMRPWPHPRSYQGVEHLARWRGATVGCHAAEAFILGRRIVDANDWH